MAEHSDPRGGMEDDIEFPPTIGNELSSADGEFNLEKVLDISGEEVPTRSIEAGLLSKENEILRSHVALLAAKVQVFKRLQQENKELREELSTSKNNLVVANKALTEFNAQVKQHFEELPNLRAANTMLKNAVGNLKEDVELKTDEFDRKVLDFQDILMENEILQRKVDDEADERKKSAQLAEKYRLDLEKFYNDHAGDDAVRKSLAQKEIIFDMLNKEKDNLEAELEAFKRQQRISHKELQERMTLITKATNTIKLVDPETGARDLDRVIATFSRDRKDPNIQRNLGEDLFQLFHASCELTVQWAKEKTAGQGSGDGLRRMSSVAGQTPRDGSMSARVGGANWITMSKGTQ